MLGETYYIKELSVSSMEQGLVESVFVFFKHPAQMHHQLLHLETTTSKQTS